MAGSRADAPPPPGPDATPEPLSAELGAWLEGDGDRTLGGLIDVFDEKSFALLFVLLLGVSALPVPTAGATHVFDVIAVLVASQLVVGRSHVWVPDRWKRLPLGGGRQERFVRALLRGIRFLERFSRPRLAFLFDHRLTNALFGLVVIAFTVGAFFAPPFSGLDTLPALGVVLVSLGVLLEDVALVALGLTCGVGGVGVEVVLGKAATKALGELF